jgi:hypothetical protein
MKNPLFNMKSVMKGRYKADVGAGFGAGAETFLKSEPEREKSFGSTTLLATHLFSTPIVPFMAQFFPILHLIYPFISHFVVFLSPFLLFLLHFFPLFLFSFSYF